MQRLPNANEGEAAKDGGVKTATENVRSARATRTHSQVMVYQIRVVMHDSYTKAHKDVATSKQNDNLQMVLE